MKKVLVLIFAVTLILGVTGTAQAQLLGDLVTMEHNFPALGAPPQTPLTTTVTADASDGFQYFNIYFANPSDTSVRIDFQRTSSWISLGGPVTFNGFVFSNVDTTIQDVTVNTNFVGWDDSRITNDGNGFKLLFAGLPFNSSTFIEANLDFGQGGGGKNNVIPEPASMVLLSSGLLGLVGYRRKKA